MRPLVWLLLALLAIRPSGARRDGASQDAVDFFLQGVLGERQRLRSGMVLITGSRTTRDLGAAPGRDAFRIKFAFDPGRVYAENTEPAWVVAQPITDPPKMIKGEQTRKYFRTTEKSATWVKGDSSVYIQKPDAGMIGDFLFFDVRALGLYNWRAFHKGMWLDDMISALKSRVGEKRADMTDQAAPVVSFFKPAVGRAAPGEWRYWLSPKEGFTVVRAEARRRTSSAADATWAIAEEHIATWEQRAGVWIPVHCEMAIVRPNSRHEVVLDLEWQSVNGSIPDDLFDWRAFGAPAMADVYDSTSGETILITSKEQDTSHATHSIPWRVWLIAANVVAIIAIICLYWRSRPLRTD